MALTPAVSVKLSTGSDPGASTRVATDVDGVPATAGAALTDSAMPLIVADTAAAVMAAASSAEGTEPSPTSQIRLICRRAGQTTRVTSSRQATISITWQITSASPTGSGL